MAEIPESIVHDHEKNGLPRLSSLTEKEITERSEFLFTFVSQNASGKFQVNNDKIKGDFMNKVIIFSFFCILVCSVTAVIQGLSDWLRESSLARLGDEMFWVYDQCAKLRNQCIN